MSHTPCLSRRHFIQSATLAVPYLALRQPIAFGQQKSLVSAGAAEPALIEDLVAANRILADQGVLDGYGHVSVRHNRDRTRYLMSRSLAPESVTAADILEYDLDSTPVDARGRDSYLERFIHGEIYKTRSDVNAIVHNHSPSVIPFGVTGTPLRPIYHMSAFLWEGVPTFEISAVDGPSDMLVRSPALGRALAQTLGARPAALMRGHGAIVVGPSIPMAVFRSVYLEMNARLQAEAMALGGPIKYLDNEEAKRATSTLAGTVQRPWDLWKKKALDR